jgi:hypothetical protein
MLQFTPPGMISSDFPDAQTPYRNPSDLGVCSSSLRPQNPHRRDQDKRLLNSVMFPGIAKSSS